MVLLLTGEDLSRLLSPLDVIEAVEEGFRAYTRGDTRTPLRVGVEPPGSDGVLLAMPCAVAEPAALGTKIVSVFPANRARGLPTLSSLYLLSDAETGASLALIDGGVLTGLRTAAGSAVATRWLAPTGAHTLGVFGTGVQAWYHVEAIRQVRGVDEVLVVGTTPAKAEAFAESIATGAGFRARAASAAEASACDILALCTTSPTPVLEDGDVRPGAHINAVGAFTPTTREMPGSLVARSRVFADTTRGVMAEAGDVLLAQAEGAVRTNEPLAGELGEVLLERVPGRLGDADITIYKSVGAAFLDAVTAHLAYRIATESGAGTSFSFSSRSPGSQ